MRDSARDTTQGFRATRSHWHEHLEACRDTHEILSLSRDYLATLTPEHLARLPEGCRPGRIKGEDDIAYWSCKLAQHDQAEASYPVDAELMQEILNYFLHAWVRIGEIQRVRSAAPAVH